MCRACEVASGRDGNFAPAHVARDVTIEVASIVIDERNRYEMTFGFEK